MTRKIIHKVLSSKKKKKNSWTLHWKLLLASENLRFCGLESFYFYFLLGAAFLFKSLGADSSKRPWTPLGAHQWGFYRIKDNTAFCDLRPNYVSCIIQKILIEHIVIESIIIPGQYSSRFSINSFASFHSYHCYFTNNNKNRKRRNLTPSN
jgi:hypothetical protein